MRTGYRPVSSAALDAEQSTAGEFQFNSFRPDAASASSEGVLLLWPPAKLPTSLYARLSAKSIKMFGCRREAFASPLANVRDATRDAAAAVAAAALAGISMLAVVLLYYCASFRRSGGINEGDSRVVFIFPAKVNGKINGEIVSRIDTLV